MFIPSLYAWFNIKALWDPYANTSQLPIAVYSDDRTEKFQDKSINIGDEVLKNLKENKQLGWKFVDSKQELDKGVKSGKYYAGIYLPADFSKICLASPQGISRSLKSFIPSMKNKCYCPKNYFERCVFITKSNFRRIY